MNTTKNRRYSDVKAVADRYDCHPSSVWRWVAQNKFPKPVKIGGITRWIDAELDEQDALAAADRDVA